MADIIMKYGERKKLAAKFKVSELTVRDALKFRTRSSLANLIRKAALENGGALVGDSTLKEATQQAG